MNTTDKRESPSVPGVPRSTYSTSPKGLSWEDWIAGLGLTILLLGLWILL